MTESAQGGLRIVHAHGDRITISDTTTGVELLSYVDRRAEAAWEAPKPYLHPLRTLAGDIATDYRPNDHRWHKGLQMTASHLSGSNLWGGNTYVHGEGYLELPAARRVDGPTSASTRWSGREPARSSPSASPGIRTTVSCGPRRSAASRCTTSIPRRVPGR